MILQARENVVVQHSKIDRRMTRWVIFDRSSRFCIPAHVRFGPKADLRAGRERGRTILASVIAP
jgi:hypothetical protein